jgi:hypothetical protein
MATIRMPSSAVELLSFCSRHTDPHKQTCFETYAHLLVAAAAMGFRITGQSKPTRCKSFLKLPGPIDLAIFRSQSLMPQMMSMGVVCLPDPEQVTDDAELATLIEDLAEEGLTEMELLLKRDGVSSFPWNLAEWIATPPVHSGPSL